MKKLRLPAVSRLQKLHNVGVALKELRNLGVPLPQDILPHHIVDAHREIVLKLFWSVIAHCCLNNLVSMEQVAAETSRIERLQKRNMKKEVAQSDGANVLSECQDLNQLLLRWFRAVSLTFGIHVGNLTTDVADGKALCFLIHYYHPNLLQLKEISKTTRDVNSSLCQAKLLANEKANAALANSRMSDLGGIPKMIPVMDTSSPPEEKSILLCLSFMCSRLLESNLEVRSSVLIQRRYRRYRRIIDTERKISAASVIVQIWREYKTAYYAAQRRKYVWAVQSIEHLMITCRPSLERQKAQRLEREATQNQSAAVIQVCIFSICLLLIVCVVSFHLFGVVSSHLFGVVI